MAESEAPQSPPPAAEEVLPAEKGEATNSADSHPASDHGAIIEILGARLSQLDIASDCEYCGTATFRQQWLLFPAQALLAGMNEEEHVAEWTEWTASGTVRRHLICRACIRACIQSVMHERRTCSGGWHWGVEGCDGCSSGWGEPEHHGVEGDGVGWDGVGWGFRDIADEDGAPDAVGDTDPWGA
ncbi:hypothetical protein FPV67DRAFT_1677757 [Lyophyllum atratum]|nr:hypothetical protein FPV67DRAFT_1677757 [Lyophyllum atratum]